MKSPVGRIGTLMLCGLMLMNTACTTIKPVYDVGQESYASQIKVGDRVRLTYPDRASREIVVTEVTETQVMGKIHKNSRHEPKGYEIVESWEALDSVETVKISALKTAGAGVGVVVAIPFLVVGMLMFGMGGGS